MPRRETEAALILRDVLGSDINRLAEIFVQICERHRDYRDYTRHEIHEAIREVMASFPVYRTYVSAQTHEVTDSDAQYLSQAVAAAKMARPDLEQGLFDLLQGVLLLRLQDDQVKEFVVRFQQITAAVTAKGVEDTAFYCYARLVSLNEVGGDPSRFGVAIEDFHRWCAETQARHPSTLLATSTHDTKRSEDVRARITLLSENPLAWGEAVSHWAVSNARYRSGEFPDRKTEYFLYQTLVGAWPISKDRLMEYMRKAVREAKENTSWIAPNAVYETALQQFCEAILADPEFTVSLDAFITQILPPARATSLSMNLLKLMCPGVPDIYQGTELWDLSLVDPDNRRPVDYERRKRLLAELPQLSPEQILNRSEDGLPKLWTIRQALHVRRSLAESFGERGAYVPLWATGAKASHLVSFQRGENVIVVAPRLFVTLGGWDGTLLEVPPGRWKNQFTAETIEGGKVEVNSLVNRFPVALLTLEGAG